ncbi:MULTISPECIES: TetR/AcrR family transcriptional regulator [unclassified Brevibacterium]|uniref:TetR/AcrR family transcriptional regulator n=1 Tax=unclassified Brevibacterium TaxID=2614124 RepID=UPI001E31FFDB|nr:MULTISPECIES: TetR/AcrR family transcriptional regulator [unclassified Brevibacterium]MCD1285483.1 TetR family transcriptional regulator [Brevibacterium sp. CCUG 69071]MDK8434532.1 TetR/AcrR family transcriptional regulator [Brevibacterium sp. H-BE7]
MTYHHGDLRRALLSETASAINECGVAKLSLRALAKRAGVSNAAPTHHFGDKTGLLTALAAEGFALLSDALDDDGQRASLVEMGVAYVRFALEYPAYFSVMFQPHLLHDDDPQLRSAQQRAKQALAEGVDAAFGGVASEESRIAAWSMVHGYATLVLGGAVEVDDAIAGARAVAAHLSPVPTAARGRGSS